jgi:hypothetical protein
MEPPDAAGTRDDEPHDPGRTLDRERQRHLLVVFPGDGVVGVQLAVLLALTEAMGVFVVLGARFLPGVKPAGRVSVRSRILPVVRRRCRAGAGLTSS